MGDHIHKYIPIRVGYMYIADNIPEYFVVRLFCKEDDCEEEAIGITEALEA